MARPRGIPRINYQTKTNLARVTIDGRAFYLGKKGDGSHEEIYNWLVGLWMQGGRRLPDNVQDLLEVRRRGLDVAHGMTAICPVAAGVPHGKTVAELVTAYLDHAETHYVKNGVRTSEYGVVVMALDALLEVPGVKIMPGMAFDVRDMKAVREGMIAKGWKAKTINHCLWAVRACFRWGILEGITSAEQCGRLEILPGVQAGRDGVPADEEVEPVEDEHIQATLPHLGRHVAGIVRLMRATGMRCQEVCIIRQRDCRDNGNGTWTYRPEHHKNEHRGQDRVVVLAPEAVSIVGQFLTGEADDYLFSPASAEAERLAALHAARQTPVQPSQAERHRRARPRAHHPHYTTNAVRRAIHRGVERANELRLGDAKKKGLPVEQVELVPAWNPHQVRHRLATDWLNRGIDPKLVSAQLGHKSVGAMMSQVTELYAKVEEGTLQQLALKLAQ